MKKVAMLRGSNLNKWEMQNYEPLIRAYDITAFTSKNSAFDTGSINFPVVKVQSLYDKFAMLPIYRDHILRRGGRKYFPRLERRINGFDIIHTAETHNEYSLQAINSKKQNKNQKVIVTVWENIPFFNEEDGRKRKIKDIVRKNADGFIAITERAKYALMLEGVPANKIDVLLMGIDINSFKPAKKNTSIMKHLGLKEGDFTILSIGRLDYEKGFANAILATKLLIERTRNRNIKLLIVGNGPEEDNLRSLTKKLGLEANIVFKPGFPYKDIPDVHNLADVFMLLSIPTPGWQEQFGMVYIEAMACGKPVIGTLSGSIPEVISDGGILVQPSDILTAYEALLSLYNDKKARSQLGQKARARAERTFDSAKVSQKIKDIYDKLLRQ